MRLLAGKHVAAAEVVVTSPAKTPLGKPLCNGCQACCKTDLVVLHRDEGDGIETYKTKLVRSPETGEMVPALQQLPNGHCIYLTEQGCGVYDRRPSACKRFDCRLAAWQFETLLLPKTTRAQRQAIPNHVRNTLRQGRKRMETLSATYEERMTYKNHTTFKLIKV